MFVCNINFNKTKAVKWLFGFIAVILIILFISASFRIYKESKKQTCQPDVELIELTNSNYTNVLKEVHDNLDKYIGKKIKFTGYIYRVPDFTDTQFVLARDMVINSNLKTLVVGFLCNYNNAKKFDNNTWVEITGTITKGTYHEEVPVIEVTQMKNISRPAEIYVYPPDEAFVPTVNLF